MSNEIWKRDEVESPCVEICTMHPEARICVGCHRTAEEITIWSRLTPAERREIMAELPERGAALKVRRGGRRARLKK